MPVFFTHNQTTSEFREELNLFLEGRPSKRNFYWLVKDSNDFFYFEIDKDGKKRSLQDLVKSKTIKELRWLPTKGRLQGIGLSIEDNRELIKTGLFRTVTGRFSLNGRVKSKSEEYCISFKDGTQYVTKKINVRGQISEIRTN